MRTPTDPENVEDHNRMTVAVLLSLVILTIYHFFFYTPPTRPAPAQKQQERQVAAARAETADALRPAAEVLATAKRIPILGEKVTGTLSLKGLRLDDLSLNDHFTTVARTAREPLFIPSGAKYALYAESGWLSSDPGVALPSKDTVWSLAPGSAAELKGGSAPVRLAWDNGQGLVFTREMALDEKYLFTVTDSVTNNGQAPVTINPYHLTARNGYPQGYTGQYTLHEGPIGRLNGKLAEPQYKDILEGKKVEAQGAKGWLGITDKYWMAVFLPDPARTFNARISGEAGAIPHFQADLVGAPVTVAPGGTATESVRLYAGVKSADVMKAYSARFGYDRLEDAIDFGMWFFIVKPFYALFRFLIDLVGSVGGAVLALTVIVRAAMFPLSSHAYTAMAKMKLIQPQLKEIQEKYKGETVLMQEKIMALYQKENANPFSGCLPMLVQIPVFFALYKTILVAVELRHAPFWGWVHDLSAPDPLSVFNLFGLIPWTPPQLLTIGAWPLLFCFTMVVQKRLTPPMPDPIQEKIQSYFPYFITLMMAHFAVGLVIYWTWSNVLAVLQQYYILNKSGGEKVSLIRGHHERSKVKKKEKK